MAGGVEGAERVSIIGGVVGGCEYITVWTALSEGLKNRPISREGATCEEGQPP